MQINTYIERARSSLSGWPALVSLLVLLAVLLVLVLLFLNPTEIGPNGILFFFSALYLELVVFVTILLKAGQRIVKLRISRIKSMYIATAVAFAPVMLLALNTLNQLEALDIILVVIFEALALFYILKRLD